MKSVKTDLGLFILRLGVGSTMLVHGVPKLMKLFTESPIQFADPIGVGPTFSLILTVFSEVLCSVFIIIGFKTRLFTVPLAITMVVAAFIVHAQDSWASKEKAILYLIMYVALFFSGSGKYSVDQK